MQQRSVMIASLAGLLILPFSSYAACPDVGQGGQLTYLGGDITIREDVTSAGYTSELGLYSAPLAATRIDLSGVTPAGTPFIMYNWNRNQTFLGQPFPYTVTINPGDFGIPLGPIDLGIRIAIGSPVGATYFMGDGSFNPDGIEHAKIVDAGGGTFHVGFEDLFGGGDCDFNDNQFTFTGGISSATLNKVLTSGPDADGDGDIDLVVTVASAFDVTYDFTIIYSGDERVLVEDTVPAEWNLSSLNASTGTASAAQVGKGNPSKSATRISWDVGDPGTLRVDATTRPSPGGNAKFAPTACGLLTLNDGAVAYEVDQVTGDLILDNEGNPIVVYGPTNGIHLIAVGDEDVGLLPDDYPRDGSGDFDGDGLTDEQEVFVVDSDPCLADTDGDGADDPVDSAPRDPSIQ